MREEKKEEKVRTTIDVDREAWAFVKSEATLRKIKTSDVVDAALEAYRKTIQKKLDAK